MSTIKCLASLQIFLKIFIYNLYLRNMTQNFRICFYVLWSKNTTLINRFLHWLRFYFVVDGFLSRKRDLLKFNQRLDRDLWIQSTLLVSERIFKSFILPCIGGVNSKSDFDAILNKRLYDKILANKSESCFKTIVKKLTLKYELFIFTSYF